MNIAALYRKKLSADYYLNPDVCQLAIQLLGKLLVTHFNNQLTVARIVETEAYNGVVDKASHAYGGRRTNRTAVMYETGGIAYVYLCYGVHHLFNVVSSVNDEPHAVLIRAAEPVFGMDTMLQRSNKERLDFSITRGPGNVSKALGIQTDLTGMSLQSDQLFLADDGFAVGKKDYASTPRIGVDYAGEDALLPYRFIIRQNKYVSGKKQFRI